MNSYAVPVSICEGWGDAQVKMSDETDYPYEDPEPPVTVLPLCTDPRLTCRLRLLGPGNGRGGCVQSDVTSDWKSGSVVVKPGEQLSLTRTAEFLIIDPLGWPVRTACF